MSSNVKRDTCFMEAVRRILNVSNDLPWEDTVIHLRDYSNCMRISGYSQTERYHAINGAVERVREMKREVQDCQRCSLFRDRESIMAAKRSKQDWSNTWYLSSNAGWNLEEKSQQSHQS